MKDTNNCEIQEEIVLTDPDEIIVDLPDAEICVGGSYRATLDLGTNIEYTWTLNDDFTTSGSEVILDQVGVYTVLATDAKGCVGEGSFSLSTNEDLLQADFLMTTESFVGDTVVVIDISWPIPENVKWNFGEKATILTSSNDFAEVIFTEEGVYDIELDATLAECADYKSQQITILGADEKGGDTGGRVDGDQEPLITSMRVYPNPSDGRFSVSVELSRSTAINVKLIDATGNRQIFNEDQTGSDSYTLEYSLFDRLQPGLYFVSLTVENQSKVVRMMIRG